MMDISTLGRKELIKAMDINFVPSRRHIQPHTTSTIQQRCMHGKKSKKMTPTFGMLFRNAHATATMGGTEDESRHFLS